MLHPRPGMLTPRDVEQAKNVLDAVEGAPVDEPARGELVGLIAVALADARQEGYDVGVAKGRRDVAAVIADALEGEGLL